MNREQVYMMRQSVLLQWLQNPNSPPCSRNILWSLSRMFLSCSIMDEPEPQRGRAILLWSNAAALVFTNASEYSQAWPSSVKSCVLWSKTKGIYFDNLFQSIVINTIFHPSFLGVFPSFVHVEGKDIISYISVHKCKALVKKPRL